MKPERSGGVPAFEDGTPHILEAAIEADTLTARVDDEVVWQGKLAPVADELHDVGRQDARRANQTPRIGAGS